MICDVCFLECEPDKYDEHVVKCIDEQQNFYKQYEQNKTNTTSTLTSTELTNINYFEPKLTLSQETAMTYVKKKSKVIAHNMKLLTLAKFQFKGHTRDDLESCITYIKSMPIIIHIHLEKYLKHLIKDTEYRNQFETNTSSGTLSQSSRQVWEQNLFGKAYDNCKGSERVKYGVVNILNQKNGVSSALAYGNSYIELKNEVKERSSFVLGDSSQKQFHICSFDKPVQLLYYIDDKLLEEIIKKAKNPNYDPQNYNYIYIELQVHGPVRLSEDIEWLTVNINYEHNHEIMEQVHEFCRVHNVKYRFTDVVLTGLPLAKYIPKENIL